MTRLMFLDSRVIVSLKNYNDMKTPLLSIIMPVYNSIDYLSITLNCIVEQTYSNFELIAVDDGSTDGSGLILDQYAQKYPFIKVFHRENSGVSAARNFGLSKAQGELIGFVDSDDMPTPTFYESLVIDLIENKADLAISDTSFIDSKEDRNINVESATPRLFDINDDSIVKLVFGTDERKFYCIWDKVYRGAIIRAHNILFNTDLKIGEDTLFILTYLFHCTSITINDAALYRHRIRNGSLMRSNISMLAKQNICKIRSLQNQLDSSHYPKSSKAIIDYFHNNLIYQSFTIGNQTRRDFKESIAELKRNQDIFNSINKGDTKMRRLLIFVIRNFKPTVGSFILYYSMKLRSL